MKRRELLGLAVALAGGVLLPGCGRSLDGLPGPAATPTVTTDPRAASRALAGFGADLFGQLAPTPQNVVFSPWSIAMVLSMIREGAAGETASALDQVLGLPAPSLGEGLASGERAMLGTGRLQVGNALWGQSGMAWQEAFLDRLANVYAAPLTQHDFRADAEGGRREINAWVSDQTAGKIPELLTPGLVTMQTRLVLVDALHFRAPWATPLDEIGQEPFATPSGTATVPTLAGEGEWPWYDRDGWQGTALPCKDGDFALVVVLPKDASARSVPPSPLFADVLAADPRAVSLQLPAWKLDYRAALQEALTRLGAGVAFDPDRADLSGMTDSERLFVSFLVHQAVIEVTAGGIEAAAATAGGIAGSAARTDLARLVLDRCFDYALVHIPSGTVLMLGQVADPGQTSVG